MKPRNHLQDVNVSAISLVTKGANRKRFFLRKSEGGDAAEVELSVGGRILKEADWSAVYCVVAEPGWEESPGQGAADQEIPDVWVSEDEIRKAAHRFVKNGGLVTRMHETLEPFGQHVESAVALADFDVDGETIMKGSWYIAIEPTAEGRDAIEKGEFTGVSIEGTGTRVLVKAAAPAPKRGSLDGMKGMRGFLKKLGERSGMTADELAALDEIEKASTFAETYAQRELDEELPDAMDALRSVIWRAYYPDPDDDDNPREVIATSLDEFKDWALELIDRTNIAKGAAAPELGRDAVAKALGVEASDADGGNLDSEMGLTTEERAEIDGLKESVEALPDEGKIAEIVKAAVTEAAKPADDEPTAESVTKAVKDLGDEIKDRFTKVEADVKKLGAGGSTQLNGGEPEPVKKADEPEHAGIL